MISHKRIGDILVSKALITEENLAEALKIQKAKIGLGDIQLLGSILVDQNFILKSFIDQIILENIEPPTGKEYSFIASKIKELIGEEAFNSAKRSVGKERGDSHIFLMLDRLGTAKLRSQKKFIYDLMRPFIPELILGVQDKISCSKSDNNQTYIFEGQIVDVVWCPKINSSLPQVLVSRLEWDELTNIELSDNPHDKKGGVKELPFSVEEIITDAINKNASDIHILYKEGGYPIHFRIDGDLVHQKKYSDYMLNLEKGQELVYAFKNLASTYTGSFYPDDIFEVKDGRIVFSEISGGVDVRIVLLPDGRRAEEELVARLFLKKAMKKIPLSEQGYYDDDAMVIEKAFQRRNGFFIISGITGAGKTQLAGQLLLGDNERKIETIENPIEYQLPNINICQHQINIPKEGTPLDYAELVTGFKRGDPDLIYISEIRRDAGLFLSAVEAAYSGQLVMSTIHINSAFDIFKALKEVFGVDYFTTSSLILYSHNQFLVKKLCECKIVDTTMKNKNTLEKIKEELPYSVTDLLDQFIKNPTPTFIKNPTGCHKCGGSGYIGRTPIYEYFYPTVKFVRWLIDNEPDRYAIEHEACSGTSPIGVNKLQTFVRKLKDGVIDASPQTIKSLM